MLDLFNNPYLPGMLTLLSLYFVCIVIPGPDFTVVTRNSLMYSKRAGLFTALGTSLGMCFHTTYTLIGIGILIQQSSWGFTILKYVGAAYLAYIGWQAIRSKDEILNNLSVEKAGVGIGDFAALRCGFLTNALNPLAMMFFLSMFAAIVAQHTPNAIKLVYGVEIFSSSILWFGAVALFFSYPKVRDTFAKLGHWVGRITGSVLFFLGIKLVLTVAP